MKSRVDEETDLQLENRHLKQLLAESKRLIKNKTENGNLLKTTLQELNIHQEELRAQNENLIQAHTEIEITNRKYQDLYNFAPVGYFNFDRHGKIVEVNLTGAALLERYRNDLLGKPLRLFLAPESKEVFSKHLQYVGSGHPASDTIWLAVKEKPFIPAEIVSKPLDSEDTRGAYCRSAITDISERHKAEQDLRTAHQKLELINQEMMSEIGERQKAEETLRQSEKQIKATLREKEVLLQEIHHRVKNNMQVIQSLLNLQAANIRDEKLRMYFSESQSRINAMAMIHEMLYQSDSLTTIDMKAYVPRLVSALAGMHGISPDRVKIKVDAEPIRLGIDQAVPCGLAMNELVSNAFMHAFPDGFGEIRIKALVTDDKNIRLIVGDNGVGIPVDLEFHSADTLGLKLVCGLVERQLDGSVAIKREQGTQITIQFPQKTPNNE